MPQVVPVSDFRSDIKSVSRHTDQGEVVILTQNGRPRWAMIDFDEWNAAAREQERSIARSIAKTEARERAGRLDTYSAKDFQSLRASWRSEDASAADEQRLQA